jgi:hypothetical protein
MCTTTIIRYWGYCSHLINSERVESFCCHKDTEKCIKEVNSQDKIRYVECDPCQEARKEEEEEAKLKALAESQ